MKVSVITPSYNQGIYIQETIQSVVDQGAALGDYVIIDGGSTDETIGILARYSTDGRIKRIVSEVDKGQADALNKGAKLVTDEIMCYLNSDDLLEPGTLAAVVRQFEAHPEYDILCGSRIVVGPRGRVIRCIEPTLLGGDDFYRSMTVFQEATFWRRSAFDRAGGKFDDTFQFAMDFELLCRMYATGSRIGVIAGPLGRFRVHGKSKTSTIFWSAGMAEIRRIWVQHGLADMSNEEYRAWNLAKINRGSWWEKARRRGGEILEHRFGALF